VLNSPGQPLDPDTRAFFEPRFGHDFSGVRLHADVQSAQASQAIQARAFTFGTTSHSPRENFVRQQRAGKSWLTNWFIWFSKLLMSGGKTTTRPPVELRRLWTRSTGQLSRTPEAAAIFSMQRKTERVQLRGHSD